MDASTQPELMFYSRRIVRRAARWFLRACNCAAGASAKKNLAFFRPGLRDPGEHLYEVMDEQQKCDERRQAVAALMAKQVPEAIARQVAHMSSLFSCLDLAQIAAGAQDRRTARRQRLLPSRCQAGSALVPSSRSTTSRWANHWQAMARASLPRGSGLAAAQPHFRGTGRVQRAGGMRYHTDRLDFRSMSSSCPVGPTCWPTSKTTSTHEFKFPWPCES